MKNQIYVTSVLKMINNSIQKIQITEKTLNENFQHIEQSVLDITDNFPFYQAQFDRLEMSGNLLENYTILENLTIF